MIPQRVQNQDKMPSEEREPRHPCLSQVQMGQPLMHNPSQPSSQHSPANTLDGQDGQEGYDLGKERNGNGQMWPRKMPSPMTDISLKPQDSNEPTSSSGSKPTNVSAFGSGSPRRKYALQEVKMQHVLKLMNHSLLLTFCDRKPTKSEGIILSNDLGGPRLTAVSPALFTPGYFEVGYWLIG